MDHAETGLFVRVSLRLGLGQIEGRYDPPAAAAGTADAAGAARLPPWGSTWLDVALRFSLAVPDAAPRAGAAGCHAVSAVAMGLAALAQGGGGLGGPGAPPLTCAGVLAAAGLPARLAVGDNFTLDEQAGLASAFLLQTVSARILTATPLSARFLRAVSDTGVVVCRRPRWAIRGGSTGWRFGHPTTRTALHPDGPNHLGFRQNALPGQ